MGSRSKKTGESEAVCAAENWEKETVMFLDSGPPGAGRQKGGLYDDIKRIKKPGETCRS